MTCAWAQLVYERGGDVVAASVDVPQLQELLGSQDEVGPMACATHIALLPAGKRAVAACLQGGIHWVPGHDPELDGHATEMTSIGAPLQEVYVRGACY